MNIWKHSAVFDETPPELEDQHDIFDAPKGAHCSRVIQTLGRSEYQRYLGDANFECFVISADLRLAGFGHGPARLTCASDFGEMVVDQFSYGGVHD